MGDITLYGLTLRVALLAGRTTPDFSTTVLLYFTPLLGFRTKILVVSQFEDVAASLPRQIEFGASRTP